MKCAYHPDREPVGVCVECGRFICMECKAMLGGKMYCTPCADKKFVQDKPPAAPSGGGTQPDSQAAVPSGKTTPAVSGGAEPPRMKGDEARSEHAPGKRRGALRLIIALTVIAVILGGGFLWFKGQDGSPSGVQTPRSSSSPSPTAGTTDPATPSALPRKEVTGTITTGTPALAASGSVGPNGGTIKVTEPSSPIAGLELTVPPKSYPDTRQVKITAAPVQSQTFGAAFNPITPLIKIDNGGGYSDGLMTVKIPAKVPPGKFAMGFIYDGNTKRLEGLPLVATDANSITVATRHFSEIVISAIDELLLDGDVESGFRPRVDDWQFPNFGSYIASGGHCAGQSITALWYYSTEPDGKNVRLYGTYDNNGNKTATSKLWQDDSLGYRFASTIQEDVSWGNLANTLMNGLAGVNDRATWMAFSYAMRLTGEPQLTYIWSKAGAGHAMIVYRIQNGNLLIADPNYPGNLDPYTFLPLSEERRIEYANGKFKPYNSGANAAAIKAGNGIAFEYIAYAAKTSTIDWDKIARRWPEVKNKTIGNDRFPAYTVWVVGKDSRHELKDGDVFTDKLLNIESTSDTDKISSISVWNDGVPVTWDAKGNLELKPGNNLLGVLTNGDVGGKDQYVDFKYFNVRYNAPSTPTTAAAGYKGHLYLGAAPYQQPAEMTHGLYVIDAENGRWRLISPRSIDGVSLSPDGTKLAAGMLQETGSGPGDPQLAIFDAKDPGFKLLRAVFKLLPWENGPQQLTGPTWAKDSNMLVVSEVGDLHLYDYANNKGSRKIMTGWQSALSPKDDRLVVAGGGLSILYDARKGAYNNDPWSQDPNLIQVANQGAVTGLGGMPSDATRPVWSPDGSRILFISKGIVMSTTPSGGGPTALTPADWKARAPTFSPDGSYIAFVRAEVAPNGGIWVMKSDGTNAKQLVKTDFSNFWRIDLTWGQ